MARLKVITGKHEFESNWLFPIISHHHLGYRSSTEVPASSRRSRWQCEVRVRHVTTADQHETTSAMLSVLCILMAVLILLGSDGTVHYPAGTSHHCEGT